MPYIEQAQREKIADGTVDIKDFSVGDLNFLITSVLNQWLVGKGLSYENLNAAAGVLACAQMELYRRVTAVYENTKLAVNGDVYGPPKEDKRIEVLS